MNDTITNPGNQEGTSIKTCAYALFAIAFVPAYFYFMGYNIALFTYFPETMEFRWGTVKMPESGPGMTWYGWMGWAAITGASVALLAFIPAVRKMFSSSRWASVAASIAVIISVILVWFYRKDFM